MGLDMIYGRTGMRWIKAYISDGNVSRLECCRLLKTEALKNTLSGKWPRYRLNHAKKIYEIDRIQNRSQVLLSV